MEQPLEDTRKGDSRRHAIAPELAVNFPILRQKVDKKRAHCDQCR